MWQLEAILGKAKEDTFSQFAGDNQWINFTCLEK